MADTQNPEQTSGKRQRPESAKVVGKDGLVVTVPLKPTFTDLFNKMGPRVKRNGVYTFNLENLLVNALYAGAGVLGGHFIRSKAMKKDRMFLFKRG